jgi:hypothetical protein
MNVNMLLNCVICNYNFHILSHTDEYMYEMIDAERFVKILILLLFSYYF